MKVLLHADGGKGVGLGHTSRCVALASALQRAGHQPLIAVNPVLGLASYLDRYAIPYCECPVDATGLEEQAFKINASAIVIDSYRWLASDFTALQGRWPIVVFDDEAIRELPVDAIVNGAPEAKRLNYRGLHNTRLWLGPSFQLVRDEFRAKPSRILNGSVRRVIVLVGGDDPLNLLPILANTLEHLATFTTPRFSVELICGPFTAVQGLQAFRHVEVLRDPLDLPERMTTADLAISAAGQTLYELARCGTPTIAFGTGYDQLHNLTALTAEGVIANAGNANRPEWINEIRAAIELLVGDAARRTAMSRAGQSLIDGRGADRLVQAIELLGSSGPCAEIQEKARH